MSLGRSIKKRGGKKGREGGKKGKTQSFSELVAHSSLILLLRGVILFGLLLIFEDAITRRGYRGRGKEDQQ